MKSADGGNSDSPAQWSDVLDLLKSPSLPALLMMSIYLLTLFMVWLVVSRGLYLSLIETIRPPACSLSPTDLRPSQRARLPVLEQCLRIRAWLSSHS